MGFFSKSKPNIEWRHLKEMSQLDEIIEASKSRPQLIFKHSTRCGVSSTVLRQFDGQWSHNAKITPWQLDLIVFRNISNDIADRFGIQHQSPQIIVVVNGQALMHVSHSPLSSQDLDSIAA